MMGMFFNVANILSESLLLITTVELKVSLDESLNMSLMVNRNKSMKPR